MRPLWRQHTIFGSTLLHAADIQNSAKIMARNYEVICIYIFICLYMFHKYKITIGI